MKFASLLPFCLTAFAGNSSLAQTVSADPLASILYENPDPFLRQDLSKVVSNYGTNGSGVKLALGGISLIITENSLVSGASTIDGATNIFSDPNGFGFTVGLSGDYLFDFDKAALKPEAETALQKVMALYAEYGGENITIEGHTDSKGSDAYNQKLSVKRAQSVEKWLAKNGIETSSLTSVGLGETKPVAPNSIGGRDNPDGRALNRRVDIKVTTTKKVNHLPTISNSSGYN
ncbi:OmpA family protein [Amylibacter sp. SFDW26]|uniref:OmpA family protein n=1 Tax=Amylibacter sp. SFDW26 TaxID=2652722 RepID=UPI00186A4D4C|nr:OmpA family protein [Amylibacter sp. SFDW26]